MRASHVHAGFGGAPRGNQAKSGPRQLAGARRLWPTAAQQSIPLPSWPAWPQNNWPGRTLTSTCLHAWPQDDAPHLVNAKLLAWLQDLEQEARP